MNHIQIDVNTDISYEKSELNGFNTMFKRQHPDILGCPMGRGRTVDASLADLKRRTEIESPVTIEYLAG